MGCVTHHPDTTTGKEARNYGRKKDIMINKRFIVALIILIYSCGTTNKRYDMFSKCYSVNYNIEEINFHISKKNIPVLKT